MNFTIIGNEITCHAYPTFKKVCTNHSEALQQVMYNHDQLENEVIEEEKKMVTIEEIKNHFNTNYADNKIILNIISQKSNDELFELYEKDLMMIKEKNEINEKGLTTYRAWYETKEDEEVIVKFMRENNMYCFDDGNLNYGIHVGNYCIVNIPENFLNVIKEKFNITRVDLKRNIVGKKDIEGLKVGDKVKIYLDGMFGASMDQGTIHEINGDEIKIRKYKSKTKGYIIKVGQIGEIEKVSKFTKVA